MFGVTLTRNAADRLVPGTWPLLCIIIIIIISSSISISALETVTMRYTNLLLPLPLTSSLSFISERELTFTVYVRYNYAIARSSVVCLFVVWNVRAPYLAGWNFRQFFFALWCLGHPLTFTKNLRRLSQANPSVGEFKRKRVSQI